MSSKSRPMERVLRKYGNSTVLVLPPAVLRELGIQAGHAVSLRLTLDGGLALTPRTAPPIGGGTGPGQSPQAPVDGWRR